MRRRTVALPLAVAAALIVPSLASAQGGSGGGGGGGGTASCNPLPTFKVTAGYAPSSTMGAVWTQLGITNCAPLGSYENVRLSIVNTGTGVEEVAVDVPYAMTVDDDSAATSTTYRVTVTATDGMTGAVIGSKSATVTTPKAKDRSSRSGRVTGAARVRRAAPGTAGGLLGSIRLTAGRGIRHGAVGLIRPERRDDRARCAAPL